MTTPPADQNHEPDHDLSWALSQVENAFPETSAVHHEVMRFLDWWSGLQTDAAGNAEVLRVVRDLLNGTELEKVVVPRRERRWVPALQGIEHSDVGRVRPDFLHTSGWKLNGRVGVIVGIRRGDVILQFDQKVPGAPDEHRGPIGDFEVDLGHLDLEGV